MIRGTLLAISVLAGLSMGYLAFSSGRDFQILGLTITSHDFRRPLLFLTVALSAFMLSTTTAGRSRASWPPAVRLDGRWIAGALALTVFVLGFVYATRVAGGADSSGYVSQAELWRRGELIVQNPLIGRAPWPVAELTFSPLGYRPSADGRAVVPSYPPGLPMLMAGAMLIAGHCAAFWVVPISGAAIVFGTYLLGRRLSHSRVGLAAAALAASSPVFLFMLPQPLSDVPVTAAWTLALLWLYSRRVVSAAASGLASGVGVLIRPNLAPLAIVLLGWLVYKVARAADTADRRQRLRQLAAYLAGIAPAVVVLAWFNWHLYGGPLRSGYGNPIDMFAWSNLLPNARNYLVWFAQMHTVLPLAGVAALCIPRVWPRAADRSFILTLAAFVALLVAQYCAYGVFDAWWYLRFLLPAFPIVMIAFAQIAWRLASTSQLAGVAVTLVILALLDRSVRLGVKEEAFNHWHGESRYVVTAHLVRDLTDQNSVVLSGQHSGSLRYYSGRMTLTFFAMNRKWLDRTVDWLEAQGLHPYALLDDWEVVDFKNHFTGAEKLTRLDGPPIMAYLTAGTTRLYDLSSVAQTQAPFVVREQTDAGGECHPPGPRPRIVLK